MKLSEFIALIRKRTDKSLKSLGITTASGYLRELEGCGSGGFCPAKLLGNYTESQWRAARKRADNQLVYHLDGMEPSGRGWKAAGDGDELPPHTIATFPAVITTTRQDRDGDVLESEGCELDPKSPLLWQHVPLEPIGRLLGECQRSKKRVTGEFSIADTPLGQDAAVLAEHGALRISHGFIPDEIEPLDDEHPWEGMHVLKFRTVEVSLVSVPSNPDAELTAFSREKLHHPLVKEFIGHKYRTRQKFVKVDIDIVGLSDAASESNSHACTCGKSHGDDAVEKRVVPYAATTKADQDKPWDADAAVKRLRKWAGVDGDEPTDAAWKKYAKGFARVNGAGTKFGDFQLPHHDIDGDTLVVVWKGVVAARAAVSGARGGMDLGNDKAGVIAHLDKHYKQFGEEPPDDKDKAAMEVDSKAFIAPKHVKKLAKAMEHLDKAIGHEDATPGIVQAAKRANAHVKAVHDAHAPDDEGEKAPAKAEHIKRLKKAMGYCSAGFEHDDSTAPLRRSFKAAKTQIKSVVDDLEPDGNDADDDDDLIPGDESTPGPDDKGTDPVLKSEHVKRLKKASANASKGMEHEESTDPVVKLFKGIKADVDYVLEKAGGEKASETPNDGSDTPDNTLIPGSQADDPDHSLMAPMGDQGVAGGKFVEVVTQKLLALGDIACAKRIVASIQNTILAVERSDKSKKSHAAFRRLFGNSK